MGYGKFFASAFTGSMAGSGPEIFAVWGYIIATTVDSVVEINPLVCGASIGMPAENVERCLESLCEPDPKSRNEAHDGRRLIKTGPFTYDVVSHRIYRDLRNEEERRDYNRTKKRESRERQKVKENVKASNAMSNKSAQAEAEAEAEAETTGGGGSDAPLLTAEELPEGSPRRTRLERWIERTDKADTIEDGPPARHDPIHERIRFVDWFPSQRLVDWVKALGLTDRNFDAMLSQARDNITGKHDVEWLDNKISRYVKTAIAQQKYGKTGTKKGGHRQPSRGDVDPHEFDAPKAGKR